MAMPLSQARHPDRTIAFSLPRFTRRAGLRGARDRRRSVRALYCVLRLGFPDANRLSTRENAALRDRLADICITQMSAGSAAPELRAPEGGGSGEGSSSDPSLGRRNGLADKSRVSSGLADRRR